MLRKVLSVVLMCVLLTNFASCLAEEGESPENTPSWLDTLLSALSEPEPAREPIYGSLDDKACTAAYVEVEYAFRNILKDARTDVYSCYFIVACVAANEIENTLFNSDSDIYGKVGRTEYLLSLDYLFGKNVDTESDSFKTGMEHIRKYFMQESADACVAFYDDLIEYGYMDEEGTMDLSPREFSGKIGISKGAVYAILEELNLYQSNPINGLKK